MNPPRICVFAGSRPGEDPRFAAAADELGRALAERGLGLVFGGEALGLMGAVADGALAAGGEAIAVIPRFLAEVGTLHTGSELRLVDTLGERKKLMADLAAGFVALPGGLGTLDELTEMATWTQLGVHAKPVVVLDVAGSWTPLAGLLDTMVANGFLRQDGRTLLHFATDPAAAIAAVES